jgi:hypothetical protein
MAEQFNIAGTNRLANVISESINIERVLASVVDTLSFDIKNLQPNQGDDVRVINNAGEVLFGGIVDVVKYTRKINNVKLWSVDCQDYTYQIDKRLVVETYENMTADLIAKDIITKYCPGFTVINVRPNAPVVEYIFFDYKRVSECLKELADYVGWDWYVDYDRDVWFFDPKTLNQSAPIMLEEGATNYRNFTHSIDQQGLRNRVYIRGGKMLSDPFTYEVVADGKSKIWNLPHKPHDLSMSVNTAPVTVGIEYVDKEVDFAYLLNFNEKYVKAIAGTALIPAGTTISWTYRYEIDVITMVEDIESQNAIAAAQGGDGIYEHVIVDDSLVTIDAAEAAGNSDLKENSNPKVKGGFETETTGWVPGQLVSINLPERGVVGTYIVQKVTIYPLTPTEWSYKIEYGGRLLGIADFLKAIVSSQQKKKLADTNLIHKFIYLTDEATVEDALTVINKQPPFYVEPGYEDLRQQTVPASPAFARTSTAVLTDGTQVEAGVPRIEPSTFGKGLILEGPSQNFCTNPSFDTNLTGWTGEFGTGTFLRDTTNQYSGAGCLKLQGSDNTANKRAYFTVSLGANEPLALSAWAKTSATSSVRLAIYLNGVYSYGNYHTGNGVYQRLTVGAANGASPATATCYVYSMDEYTPSWIDDVMAEKLPMATSYHPTTRAGETLDVPGSVFTKGNWTVEMIFKALTTMNVGGLTKYLFNAGTGTDNRWSMYVLSTGAIQGKTVVGGAEYLLNTADGYATKGNTYHLMISGDNTTLTLCVNNTLVGTRAYVEPAIAVPALLNIGYSQVYPLSPGYFQIEAFRISNRARVFSDHQAAYGQELTWDENTTYLMDFNNGFMTAYMGFGETFATVGTKASIQQVGSEPWLRFQYCTSANGTIWTNWQDYVRGAIDVPYPGFIKVRGVTFQNSRFLVKNWKDISETDTLCGFIVA